MEEANVRGLEDITSYHAHDVLIGRGPKKHEGNCHYRSLVNAKKHIYRSSKRAEKHKLAQSIVATIREQDPPGRFLDRDRSSGLWYEIGDDGAIERTKTALRETGRMMQEEATATKQSSRIPARDHATRSALSQQPTQQYRSTEKDFSSQHREKTPDDQEHTAVHECAEKHENEVFLAPPIHGQIAIERCKKSDDVGDRGNLVEAETSSTPDNPSNGKQRALAETIDLKRFTSNCQIMAGGLDASLVMFDPEQENAVAVDSLSLVQASAHSRIYRLEDKENRLGGRTGAVAIKSLTSNDGYVDPGEISRLYDEYILSRHLAQFSSIRAALSYANRSGFHALYLEWAPGVTLREWTQSVVRNNLFSQKRMIHAAWLIAKCLREVHDFGVIHNNINADNIIVEEKRDDIMVKIIDFGSACLVDENGCCPPSDMQPIVNKKQKDLFSLGVVFYEMFSGILYSVIKKNGDVFRVKNPYSEWDWAVISSLSQKRPHVPPEQTVPNLQEIDSKMLPTGVPVPNCVSSLVSNLMETGRSEGRYVSVKDVEQDLQMMFLYPDRFMSETVQATTGHLEFSSDILFGRESEISSLMEAYGRVIISGGSSEMILVSGHSGTGKSALARRTRVATMKRGGYFLSGKFHRLRQSEPLSAVVAAFTEYCKEVVKRGADNLCQTKIAIVGKVGSNCSVLTDLIPSLSGIIGRSDDAAVKPDGIATEKRFMVLFRLFVQAIASPLHPVVLFLDDLQWADVASLQLMESLVTDTESCSFLLIGAYRCNEMSSSHPLVQHLHRIREKGVRSTTIKTENVSKADVNKMISYTLRISQSLARPLTDITFEKTSGNPFFVIQFLKSLCDQGLLYFHVESERWKWDTEEIESMTVAENAIGLLASKIRTLSADIQNALKLASCLGSYCDESIIRFLNDDHSDLSLCSDVNSGCVEADRLLPQHLDVAVREGLMEKECQRYKFAHDQIQHAVYSSMPETQRCMMHHCIGNRIQKKATMSELEEVLFVVVDQMNQGSSCIHDQRDMIELARLNLKAGEKAMTVSAFLPAATYLEAGIHLLGPEQWNGHYDLSLRLHNCCVEIKYSTGKFDLMGTLLEEIFRNARSFNDKLHAHHHLVLSLGAQNKIGEAIESGLLALEKLGEPLPEAVVAGVSSAGDTLKEMIRDEMRRTNDMLDGYTDDELWNLKAMDNETKTAAMKFLYQVMSYAHFWKRELFPFITLRMIQLSLQHGICKESAFGFAACGTLLWRDFGDFKRAHRFGQAALSLAKRFKDHDGVPRLFGLVYGCINPWSEDMRLSLDPLQSGYEIGMRMGVIEHAMINANFYVRLLFQCGETLSVVEKKTRSFCKVMGEYNQNTALSLCIPFLQTVLNLIGRSHNPWQLSGELMNHDKVLKRAMDERNQGLMFCVYFHSMLLTYLFGEYETAAKMADKCREICENVSLFFLYDYVFYDGLVSLSLARSTKERKWRILSEKAMHKMKEWASNAPSNSENKLDLFAAEYAFLTGEGSKAAKLYDSAISLADKSGRIQDKALAYERAAVFHLSNGEESVASFYYDHAYNSYLKWGARAKADHVRCRSLSLLLIDDI